MRRTRIIRVLLVLGPSLESNRHKLGALCCGWDNTSPVPGWHGVVGVGGVNLLMIGSAVICVEKPRPHCLGGV